MSETIDGPITFPTHCADCGGPFETGTINSFGRVEQVGDGPKRHYHHGCSGLYGTSAKDVEIVRLRAENAELAARYNAAIDVIAEAIDEDDHFDRLGVLTDWLQTHRSLGGKP
jgi:hypothetical protein